MTGQFLNDDSFRKDQVLHAIISRVIDFHFLCFKSEKRLVVASFFVLFIMMFLFLCSFFLRYSQSSQNQLRAEFYSCLILSSLLFIVCIFSFKRMMFHFKMYMSYDALLRIEDHEILLNEFNYLRINDEDAVDHVCSM